jgi:hypothetical protein
MGLLEEQSDWTHLVGVICICVGGARHVMGPGVMGAGGLRTFPSCFVGWKMQRLGGRGNEFFFQKRVRELRRVESCRSAEGRRGVAGPRVLADEYSTIFTIAVETEAFRL